MITTEWIIRVLLTLDGVAIILWLWFLAIVALDLYPKSWWKSWGYESILYHNGKRVR